MELIRELHVLFSKIWYAEKVPSCRVEYISVLIFKKGLCSSCANHRGVSPISIASTVIPFVILGRLHNTHGQQTREEQVGFRTGCGCIDGHFTPHQLFVHRLTFENPRIVVLLDICPAFGSVDGPVPWNFVEE